MSVRLALGTVQFGLPYGIANGTGPVTPAAARAMLDMATVAGIDTLDTAIAYGSSEQCLGEVGVSGFRVITKLPALTADVADVADWVRRHVAGSLSRLGLPRLYGLLLHHPADLLDARGPALLKGLRSVHDAGLAVKIGVSVYAPRELEPIMALHPFDLVQAPLNVVDRRLVHSGWLERLASAGVEVHVRSVFLQGLLLMPLSAQTRRFPRWAALWARLDAYRRMSPIGLVASCLAYPLVQPGVERVVVGADTPEQLRAIIAEAAARPLADWPDLACDDEDLIHPSLWSSA